MKKDFPISAKGFRSQMEIAPQLQKQYDLAVKTGLRLMFDEGQREQTMEYMDGSDGMAQKIGEGISSVVQFMAIEFNGTLPGELLIPVGVELIAHAVEVAERAGMPVKQGDVAEGMAAFIESILGKAGATPEQMQQLLSGMDSGQATPGV